MKFRKKPVVIEAWLWTGNRHDMPDFLKHHRQMDFPTNCSLDYDDDCWDDTATVQTLEGRMRVNKGDWIIKGIKGELYPCKPDIFEATYERVDE